MKKIISVNLNYFHNHEFYKNIFKLFFIISILIYTQYGYSQDSLFHKAEELFSEAKYKEAAEKFRELLEKDKKSIPAAIGLIKSLYSNRAFLESRVVSEKAVTENPDCIELRYYFALITRDIARYNNTISVYNADFSSKPAEESEKNFKWIMEGDSLYKDLLYQYSVYFRFKEEYIKSLETNIRQIKLKPEEAEYYAGLLRNFTAAYNNMRKEDLERYLSGDSEIKKYLLGEYNRRRGAVSEAQKIFNELISNNSSIPKSLIYLSLYRMNAEKMSEGDFEEYYWDCFENLNKKVEYDIIFNDLKYLATDEELEEFRRMSAREKGEIYFYNFWEKRNPTMLLSINPRISEHYKRLLKAEKDYPYDKERYSFLTNRTGYQLNVEFNDPGYIYIRHGNPDDKSKSSYSPLSRSGMTGSNNLSSERTDIIDLEDQIGRLEDQSPGSSSNSLKEFMMGENKIVNSKRTGNSVCEAWLYKEKKESPKMIFFFLGGEKILTPMVFDRHIYEDIKLWDKKFSDYLFETDATRYVSNQNLRTALTKGDIGVLQKVNMLLESSSGAKKEDIIHKIYQAEFKNIEYAKKEENSSWSKNKKNFDIANIAYTFRGKEKKTLFEIYYIIPSSKIFNEIPDSVRNLKIAAGIGIFDKNWSRILRKFDTIEVIRTNKENESYLKAFQCEINPDSVGISLYYNAIGTEIYGNFKKPKRLPEYNSPGLKMSDLIITTKIEATKEKNIFNKGGLKVIPLLSDRYPLNRPVNLYFELYNLKKNLDGKTLFSVEYKIKYIGEKNILSSLFGKYKTNSISTEYNRGGISEYSAEHISIGVDKLIPGQYLVEVTIKDINGQRTVHRSREFELFEPEKK